MTLKPVKTQAPAKAPAAPLIVPNAKRSAGSTELLEHLARLWPRSATRPELTAVFAKAHEHEITDTLLKRVRAMMDNMESTGYITRVGFGKGSAWTLGPGAPLTEAMGPQRPYKDAYVGAVVPPRKYDAMKAQEYKPKAWSLRPGSNDFAQCLSVLQGQRRPFTGGYVVMAGSK